MSARPAEDAAQQLLRAQGGAGVGIAREALSKYRANLYEDCLVCWRTWIPAFLFNFSCLPIWGRIPFVAAVSFAFTSYWSFLRGKRQTLPSTDE